MLKDVSFSASFTDVGLCLYFICYDEIPIHSFIYSSTDTYLELELPQIRVVEEDSEQ